MKEDAAEKALNVLNVMVPILGNARAQVLLCEEQIYYKILNID